MNISALVLTSAPHSARVCRRGCGAAVTAEPLGSELSSGRKARTMSHTSGWMRRWQRLCPGPLSRTQRTKRCNQTLPSHNLTWLNANSWQHSFVTCKTVHATVANNAEKALPAKSKRQDSGYEAMAEGDKKIDSKLNAPFPT